MVWADTVVVPYRECSYEVQLCIQRLIQLYRGLEKKESVLALPSPNSGLLGLIDLPGYEKNQVAFYQASFDQREAEYKKRIQEKKDELKRYDDEFIRLQSAQLDCENEKQTISNNLKRIDQYLIHIEYIQLFLETFTFLQQMERLRWEINQKVDWSRVSLSDFPRHKIEDLAERYGSDQDCIISRLQEVVVHLRYDYSWFPLNYQLIKLSNSHRTLKEKALFLKQIDDAGYTKGFSYEMKSDIDLERIFHQLSYPGILKNQLVSLFFNTIQETGEYTDEVIVEAVHQGIAGLHSFTHEAIIHRVMMALENVHHRLSNDLKKDDLNPAQIDHSITIAKKLLSLWIDLEMDWLQAYGDYIIRHELPFKKGSGNIFSDTPNQQFLLLSNRASWPLEELGWPDACY